MVDPTASIPSTKCFALQPIEGEGLSHHREDARFLVETRNPELAAVMPEWHVEVLQDLVSRDDLPLQIAERDQ